MSLLEVAVPVQAHLGEGPIWNTVDGALHWVDVFTPTLHRFEPHTQTHHATAVRAPVHAIAFTAGRELLGALDDALAYIDPETGEAETALKLIDGTLINLNDGKCDRAGRFWVGAKARDWISPIGRLFRIDADLSVHRMEEGFKLSNGMGWSPDDRTMYYIDSARREIYAYDFDLARGAISNRRTLVRVPEEHGLPDGMTVDAEGFLWVAHWNGWRVVRYDPDGRAERVINVPVSRPTSCAFGGDDLTTLFVTSGTMRMSQAELAAQPLAGSLFSLRTDVQGLPESRFAGPKPTSSSE
jgi:sugar lactone lactonase YvrE